MTRRLLVALAAMTGVMCIAPSAQALTSAPVWKCRASPLYASVNGQNRVEPIVANGNINTANGGNPDHAQCADAETGAGNTATQLAIPQDTIGASTTQAKTEIVPELGKAITQKVTSTAKVENLQVALPAGSPSLLGVKAITSSATGTCVSGSTTPKLDGTSQVADLTVLGAPIGLDGLVGALANALQPLNAIVDVKINQKIPTADGLTVIGLHVKVIQGNGTPLIDLVAAETKVGFNGLVCDPNAQDGGGGGKSPCPAGSVYDPDANVCIIKGSTSGSSLGDVIVGPPYSGPSGGTVVPIDVARKKYGKSPCLSGSGAPKFAIVGTNKADRITGTNVADRIIGLGGNDKLDGGRGNDCIEGRTGGDTMSGGLGNDRIYGSSGNDVIGGSGVDFINVATAGPAASVNCGSGRDKVRANRNETKKLKGCETIYIFKDR